MEIRKVGVLGVGTIGYQIAQLCAQYGFEVNLRDIDENLVQSGLKKIKGGLKKFFVDKGKMSQEEADAVYGRITGTTDLKAAVGDVDLVIEAIPEKMELKQQVFKELDKTCPTHTILATNTSSLSPTAIGSLTNAGEVSKITISAPWVKLSRIESIRLELNNSVGLGGMGPLVITLMGGSPQVRITSFTCISEENKSLNPLRFSSFK